MRSQYCTHAVQSHSVVCAPLASAHFGATVSYDACHCNRGDFGPATSTLPAGCRSYCATLFYWVAKVSPPLTSSCTIYDTHSLSFTSSVLSVDRRLYFVRVTRQRSWHVLTACTRYGLEVLLLAFRRESTAKSGSPGSGWTSDRSQSQLWVHTAARISEQQCGMETDSVWISSAPFCQRAFRSNSVVRRWSSRVVKSLTVLQTRGFKATVLEIAPISQSLGSGRLVFARHHVDARWAS